MAKVEIDLRALKRLQRHPEEVLRDLDGPLQAETRRVLDISSFLVPRSDNWWVDRVRLADTGFLKGPLVNMGEPLSTTWFAGYSHHAAAPIHEGVHFGQTKDAPPFFLRRAMKGAKTRTRKAVATQLGRTLQRLFPPQK
jgi:hypothetical protein